MSSLEQEITKLSYIWMRYVGLDHHKDRDCHWYIQQLYSYGQPPYFQAYHSGYVAGDFEGSKCTTLEEAQEELRDRLLLSIHNEKIWVKQMIERESKDKEFYDTEEYDLMLDALNGIFHDN